MARKRDLPVFQPSRNIVDCAHEGCNSPAICKIKVSTTAWANLCDYHYNDHFTKKAKASCDAKGLTTTPQLRAAFRDGVKTLQGRLTNREFLKQREPGEDYSEDATA